MFKNILLVNPWIYDFAAYDLWMFPLGLLNIAAHLKNKNVKLSFINFLDRNAALPLKPRKDYSHTARYGTGHFFKQEVEKPEILHRVRRKFFRYGLPPELIQARLKGLTPDLILVTSGMTYWYLGVKKTTELLRKTFASTPIILGGVYATLCAEHAQRNTSVDRVYSGTDIADIIKLISRFLNIPLNINNSDPIPSFELLPNQKALPIMGSLGCPFRCTYCASNLLYPGFRQKTPAQIINYIQYCVETFRTTDFAFYDDALLLNSEDFIKPILRTLIGKKLNIRFHTPNGLHAKFIDQELANFMYKVGFKTIRLSLESSLDCLQERSRGKVTNEQLKNAVRLLRKAGFKKEELGVYTLLGFPGQTLADVERDMKFVNALGVEIHLAGFSLVPQTDEWHEFISRRQEEREIDPLLLSHTAFGILFGNFDSDCIRHLRRQAAVLNKNNFAII